MPYDPQRHHRRSIRLRGHDYATSGAYFVTICVLGRERILGKVVEGSVRLSLFGAMAEDVWRSMPRHFPRATLDAFVVMPDHIHALVVLAGDPAPAGHSAGPPHGTRPASIPAIVQNMKSVSARRINRARGTPDRRVWQEDYYEHIVRDEGDMDRIRRYIAANPARWRG